MCVYFDKCAFTLTIHQIHAGERHDGGSDEEHRHAFLEKNDGEEGREKRRKIAEGAELGGFDEAQRREPGAEGDAAGEDAHVGHADPETRGKMEVERRTENQHHKGHAAHPDEKVDHGHGEGIVFADDPDAGDGVDRPRCT